jgi:Putative transposase
VAISNHWLIALEDGRVTFRYKDYARGGKKRKMTLAAEEFILPYSAKAWNAFWFWRQSWQSKTFR